MKYSLIIAFFFFFPHRIQVKVLQKRITFKNPELRCDEHKSIFLTTKRLSAGATSLHGAKKFRAFASHKPPSLIIIPLNNEAA
ncbi:hypothetical protein ACQP3J_27245, partial [Escherichia coli]